MRNYWLRRVVDLRARGVEAFERLLAVGDVRGPARAAPKSVDAVAGKLTFSEVLLAVGEPYGPEPALISRDGKVIGLQMCGYDDRLLGCVPELASAFPPPASCPPGF